MKHYLIIGRTEPGSDNLFFWSGPEQSLEHAERCFYEDAWGETTDPEEREAAESEGYAPSIEAAYVSDTPIRIA